MLPALSWYLSLYLLQLSLKTSHALENLLNAIRYFPVPTCFSLNPLFSILLLSEKKSLIIIIVIQGVILKVAPVHCSFSHFLYSMSLNGVNSAHGQISLSSSTVTALVTDSFPVWVFSS